MVKGEFVKREEIGVLYEHSHDQVPVVVLYPLLQLLRDGVQRCAGADFQFVIREEDAGGVARRQPLQMASQAIVARLARPYKEDVYGQGVFD